MQRSPEPMSLEAFDSISDIMNDPQMKKKISALPAKLQVQFLASVSKAFAKDSNLTVKAINSTRNLLANKESSMDKRKLNKTKGNPWPGNPIPNPVQYDDSDTDSDSDSDSDKNNYYVKKPLSRVKDFPKKPAIHSLATENEGSDTDTDSDSDSASSVDSRKCIKVNASETSDSESESHVNDQQVEETENDAPEQDMKVTVGTEGCIKDVSGSSTQEEDEIEKANKDGTDGDGGSEADPGGENTENEPANDEEKKTGTPVRASRRSMKFSKIRSKSAPNKMPNTSNTRDKNGSRPFGNFLRPKTVAPLPVCKKRSRERDPFFDFRVTTAMTTHELGLSRLERIDNLPTPLTLPKTLSAPHSPLRSSASSSSDHKTNVERVKSVQNEAYLLRQCQKKLTAFPSIRAAHSYTVIKTVREQEQSKPFDHSDKHKYPQLRQIRYKSVKPTSS
ncbi:uncharacterized protein LOC106170748 [Lingula anatina]|uniref:Uncharacterized protein LOC106170748 n=1 Tax=Lingula anatina TaxID=7574 RepID=A0A1S3J6Z6_LINAN|nr:uncharacterized protein LOC106170748 [Lingula anatina]|eukprot:XP_013406187.1 uncharacterized protein LOC106170748 [Lingula anatina]